MAGNSKNAKKFAAFCKKSQGLRYELNAGIERNIKDACEAMLLKAKEVTPPCNGEKRGVESWTGQLRRHWEYKIESTPAKTHIVLCNDMQYASYVDNGHAMDRHFVPWLYVDGTGCISRHKPVAGEPMFGLVVGTKTTYVPPANMTKQAADEFVRAFDYMNAALVTDLERKYGK